MAFYTQAEVDDMNELAQSEKDGKMQTLADCANGLCGIISEGQGNKSAEEYTNALAKLYDSSSKGNMLLNFMIFFIKKIAIRKCCML